MVVARRPAYRAPMDGETHAAIVAGTPVAVIVGDAAGTITEWNTAAEVLFGWTRDEAVGRNIDIVLPPGCIPLYEEHADVLRDGGLVNVMVPRVRHDGSMFKAQVTLTAAPGADHWVSVVRDVTVDDLVHRATASVAAAVDPEEAMRDLASCFAVPYGVRTVRLLDSEGAPSRALERAWTARHPVLETGTAAARLAGAEGASWAVAFPLLRRDEPFAALVCAGSGTAPSLRDISLLDEAARAVTSDIAHMLLSRRQAEVIERLRELDELRSDFVSTVSHELRTPLTTISGFAETLGERWDALEESVRRRFVGRIAAKASELTDMIDQLLDFAHLERGGYAVEPRPADLRTELAREVHRLGSVLSARRLRFDVPEGLVAMVDPRGLRRVIENLLTNAVKFSSPDSEVGVDAVDTGAGEIVVRVTDEGIGIPAVEQDLIFDRFYRVNRGDQVSARGTGIGLAVARQFVEALGGRLWVLSAPGRGSVFSFSLRAAPSGAVISSRTDRATDGRQPSSSAPRDRAADATRRPTTPDDG